MKLSSLVDLILNQEMIVEVPYLIVEFSNARAALLLMKKDYPRRAKCAESGDDVCSANLHLGRPVVVYRAAAGQAVAANRRDFCGQLPGRLARQKIQPTSSHFQAKGDCLLRHASFWRRATGRKRLPCSTGYSAQPKRVEEKAG